MDKIKSLGPECFFFQRPAETDPPDPPEISEEDCLEIEFRSAGEGLLSHAVGQRSPVVWCDPWRA